MEKQKYLFYWAEGLNLWISADEIMSEFSKVVEESSDGEDVTLKLKVLEMTEEEFNELEQF